MAQTTASGRDLKVGDTLDCWWGTDTIIALHPYTGPLRRLFHDGAQVATFARNKSGMTIDNIGQYAVLGSMAGAV